MKWLLLIVLIAGCGAEVKETFMDRFNRDPELYIGVMFDIHARSQHARFVKELETKYPMEE